MKSYPHSRTLSLFFFLLMGLGLPTITKAQVQSMPYAQDFESFATCAGSCGAICNLSAGWTNPPDDQADWTVDKNGTASGGTGPTLDHNPGSLAGNYLYFETSFPCFGGDDTAHLVSPPLDLSGTNGWGISYWLHMWGADMGELHVDLSQDGGGSWNLDIIPPISGNQGNNWFLNEISLLPWQGDTVWIRWRGISGPGASSDMAIDDIASYAIVPLNAGVTDIPAPPSPNTPGLHNVEAVITNFGTDTLLTAQVGWAVNGVNQPALSWTGNLLPGDSSATLSLGMANLLSGFNAIRAWTSSPNGGQDQFSADDSLEVSVFACNPLHGTYSVGGTGTDFPTISDATFALMNCGVAGPVVMNLHPGVYFDHIELGEITGASAINTITFDGGDADSTLISWTGGPLIPGGVGGVATVLLWGTDYTTIKNLTLENTAPTDAWGVQFRDTASYNLIDSCIIVMLPNGTGDVEGIMASGSFTTSFVEGLHSLHNTLSHNTIMGGDKGIHIEGSPTIPYSSVGNAILHNTIVAPNAYGFYFDNLDSLTVIGNTLTETRSANGDGIFATSGLQNFVFRENQLHVRDRGIHIADGNASYPVANFSLIANNMVHSSGGEAIYFDGLNKGQIFNNTLVGTVGGYFNDLDSVLILNNIFYSPLGKAVDFADATSGFFLGFDFNILYSGGSTLAEVGLATYVDLVSWQTSNPALNASSLEGDPVFASNFDDLHLLGSLANGVGLPLLTLDIDGDFRDPFTPDIGADEYTIVLADASPLAIRAPQSLVCGDSLQELAVEVYNSGINPITSLPIRAELSGDIIDTLNFTYNGVIAPFMTDTILIGTFNTYGGGTYSISLSTALPGDENPADDTLALQSYTAYPVIPSVLADSFIVCGVDTADFAAQAFPGVNYVWYDSLNGGTAIDSGLVFTLPSIASQNTYYLGYGSLQDSLTTTFAGGNGGNGNMFDIVANADILIDSFQNHGDAGMGRVVEIYYKTGSYLGFESDPLAWTWLGNDTLDYLGPGIPVTIDIGGLALTAGQTYGIYFTLTNGALDYSSLSAITTYTDGVLSLTAGAGKGYPFGTTFSPRAWNGSVFYRKAPCSDMRVPVVAFTDSLVTASFSSAAVELDASFTDFSTGEPLSWEWDFGDGSTDSVASPTHTYAMAGTYAVTLVVRDDCGMDSQTQNILLSCAPPESDFTFTREQDTLRFANLSTGRDTLTYLWDFGDGTTSTDANPTHEYTASGVYTVCLSATDVCGSDTTCQEVNFARTGIADLLHFSELQLFPNPTEGQFVLQANISQPVGLRVKLYDPVGKLVFQKEIGRVYGFYQQEFDLSALPLGIYLLKLESEGRITSLKLVRY